MKDMLKLGFILAMFASVACVCLAVVNILTAPTIAAVQAEKANAGMKVVFSDADAFEKIDTPVERFGSTTINNIYFAKQGEEVIGAVVEASGSTYNEATLLVGFDLNRIITGIEFLSLSDTPGYGQAAADPEFTNQFSGLTATSALEVGKDFDGISGSTKTTEGITTIINYAIAAGCKYFDENRDEEQEQNNE